MFLLPDLTVVCSKKETCGEVGVIFKIMHHFGRFFAKVEHRDVINQVIHPKALQGVEVNLSGCRVYSQIVVNNSGMLNVLAYISHHRCCSSSQDMLANFGS